MYTTTEKVCAKYFGKSHDETQFPNNKSPIYEIYYTLIATPARPVLWSTTAGE